MKAKAMSLWRGEQGQDIAEYAVRLAVILVPTRIMPFPRSQAVGSRSASRLLGFFEGAT